MEGGGRTKKPNMPMSMSMEVAGGEDGAGGCAFLRDASLPVTGPRLNKTGTASGPLIIVVDY